MAPSGPDIRSKGPAPGVGRTNSSKNSPEAAMRPILLPAPSANQSAPSGPGVIQFGWELTVGTGYLERICAWALTLMSSRAARQISVVGGNPDPMVGFWSTASGFGVEMRNDIRLYGSSLVPAYRGVPPFLLTFCGRRVSTRTLALWRLTAIITVPRRS